MLALGRIRSLFKYPAGIFLVTLLAWVRSPPDVVFVFRGSKLYPAWETFLDGRLYERRSWSSGYDRRLPSDGTKYEWHSG